METKDVNLDEHWVNLIFAHNTSDAKGWSLRGHNPKEKTKGWFQYIILSSGCNTKEEAIERAKEFTVTYVFTEKIMSV
jgi:hypothetical protein